MLTEKTKKVFSLSDENRKEIKENAQKIKSYLVARGCDNCLDFLKRKYYEGLSFYDYWDFVFVILSDFLPFVKEEINSIYNKDAEKIVKEVDSIIKHVKPFITKDTFTKDDKMIDFLDEKYTKMDLMEKIIEFDNKELLDMLFNN